MPKKWTPPEYVTLAVPLHEGMAVDYRKLADGVRGEYDASGRLICVTFERALSKYIYGEEGEQKTRTLKMAAVVASLVALAVSIASWFIH